ncbi:LapA family protein [Solidesulfovibrio sp. C21]|uniref:LapA family protein n=1 Tax=Solidesulfovibrio sp. C21 TaxID=3398613 RepID=UPI0039FC4B4F
MRVIKVLFLLAFFFFCMLFFVQNTAILETPLLLKLEVFGLHAETAAVPFYVVLLLSFVAGGFFCTLYFLAEKVRLASSVRSLQNKVNAMEKQLAQKKSTVASPLVTPNYAAATASPTTMPASEDTAAAKKDDA